MTQPPKLARKLFAFISGEANVDDLLGDLDEWFQEHLKTKSSAQARVIYWGQVFSLSMSYALRKRKRDARHGQWATSAFSAGMLNNYLKVALRNLYQHKYFSVINAFGLALGMSVSLLLISIYSYVSTYDNYHTDGDNIYTIVSTLTKNADQAAYASAPLALADKVDTEVPGVNGVLRIIKDQHSIVTAADKMPVRCYYTGAAFFDFFSIKLLEGNSDVLNRPDQVVLTAGMARKLFGESSALGKTLELEGGRLVDVGGVIQDPRRTHLNFDMLVSEATLPPTWRSQRDWVEFHNQYVYVKLGEDASLSDLQLYLTSLSASQYAGTGAKATFAPLALQDIATGADLRNAIGEEWELSSFLIFALFAALILLPACFNYANISIARAMRRAKEIALRKTVGGIRRQIFFQFVTETIVIALIALVGALGIFVLIRTEFQSMLVSGSSLDLSLTPRLLVFFALFAVLTGLAAGIFPALYFARMNPIQAFRSRGVAPASSFGVRKVITVLQFALSFGFILTLFAIGRQYRFAASFDFGFEKEHLLDIPLQDVKADQFMARFSALSSVQAISRSSGIMGVTVSETWLKDAANDSLETTQMFVDKNYIRNFGFSFLAGHDFPDEPWRRERYLIVNEAFLKSRKMGAPIDALGKIFSVDGQELEVIGVLKDFHFSALTHPIGNYVFRDHPEKCTYANVKVVPGNSFNILSDLEAAWKMLPTEKKFIARFFDDEIQEGFNVYIVMLKMVGFLGLMAITISLLGMVGMVVYTAQSRAREVGRRKVMGATAQQVIMLLSRDYLKMLAWAVLIGAPLTMWLLNIFIPNIQYYHADISLWDVILSIAVIAGFGVGTILLETYKTAMANPALTLKSE